MECKVKNSELLPLAEQLAQLNSENVTFGVKNRVQKIIRAINEHFAPYNKMHVEMLLAHGATKHASGNINFDKEGEPAGTGVTPPEFIAPFSELSNQENTLTFDPIDFKKIEEVQTGNTYNFEFLSRFFENYN